MCLPGNYMVPRDDLSSKLVHLISGETREGAFSILRAILNDKGLRGGTGFVKGVYKCICFSEAPVSKLGLLIAAANSGLEPPRYQPFGIMVDKEWLFSQGGRPAIYQADSEFDMLPEGIKWRHVRYEPPGVDFTWEREWRIKTDFLPLSEARSTIVVPTKSYIDHLLQEHFSFVEYAVASIGEDAISCVKPYPWHYIAMEDLGIVF
jgi:hypothetical protein